MAKKKSEALAVPQPEADWQKQLREQARDEKANETLGVARVTHKGGVLMIDGKKVAEDPKDRRQKLAIVPIGVVYAKQWYEHKYEQGSKDTPGCYSFGRTSDKGLVPHTAVPLKQADACDPCPHNAFGTALQGRGKRCSDVRKILFILAADLQKQGDEEVNKAIAKATPYQIDIPPGSLKSFGQFLSSLQEVSKYGNIRGTICEVTTAGSESGAYTVNLEFLDNVPDAAMPALIKKGEPTFDLVARPFPVIAQEEAPKPVKGQGKRR